MDKLSDIRAELVRDFESAKMRWDRARLEMDCASAKLEGYDRACEAMQGIAPAAEPSSRQPRRDIAALVLAALTDDGQTVEQLAAAIGAKPSQVSKALVRLGIGKALFDGKTLGWVRAEGSRSPAQGAA